MSTSGTSTSSIKWMIPFVASMSAATTVAPLTVTVDPETPMLRICPWSVVTLWPFVRLVERAATPGTTW
jgi:hypothetical protein